jgi:hypothetical protein
VGGRDFGVHRTHFIVLVDNPASAVIDNRRQNWPPHLRAMLAVRKAVPEVDVVLMNRDARFSRKSVARVVAPVLRNGNEQPLADWVEMLPTLQIGPPTGASPLAVLDDRWNLADACMTGVATETAAEAMTLVTVGGYPAGRFLLHSLQVIRKSARSSADQRQAHADFHGRFGSLMPDPRDGPAELMLMTVRELDSTQRVGKGVGQRRLRALWSSANPQILAQLGVTVSSAGLKQLFRVAASTVLQENQIDQSRDTDLTRRFNLSGPAAEGALTLDMLRVHIGDAVERFLPLADWGLSYAGGTRMVIAGMVRRVMSVQPEARQVRMETDDAAPVRMLDFVRDYASPALEGRGGTAAEGHVARMDVGQPHERAVGYVPFARRTRGVLEWAADGAPFSVSESPLDIPCQVSNAMRLRRVACLSILSDEVGGRPARGAGRPAPPDQAMSASVSFTLATTLSDVAAALFPMQAHRLAVLHLPGASALRAARPGPQDRVLRYVLNRQPRLVPLGPDDRPDAALQVPPEKLRRLAERGRNFAAAFLASARPGGHPTTADARLTLLLVEDADHDLGVAKAFSDAFDTRVLPFWRDYLTWCAETATAENGHPYAFGTTEVPDIFDFSEAARIVKAMQ